MTTSTSFEGGPYLLAALLCEKVLMEQDGVKSAVRIIDRVTRTATGHTPPTAMEPFDYEVTLLLKLKSGSARGSYPLRVNLVKPSGESFAPLEQTIYFEGEDDRGIDLIASIRIKLELPGVYWFEVFLGEALLTRIPFRVIYMHQIKQIRGTSGSPPPAQEPPTGS